MQEYVPLTLSQLCAGEMFEVFNEARRATGTRTGLLRDKKVNGDKNYVRYSHNTEIQMPKWRRDILTHFNRKRKVSAKLKHVWSHKII